MPIMVNHKEITDEEVFNEMQYHPATSRVEATELAARALVVRELLLQDAIAHGILSEEAAIDKAVEADDSCIQQLLLKVIKVPQANEESCQRFYDNNKDKFTDSNGQLVQFTQVQQSIAEYLTDSSWQIAVRQYIKILAGQAKISGIDFESSNSPLTQ